MAKRVIAVSFKDSEAWVYDILKKHSSPSSIVKDILKEYYANEQNKPVLIRGRVDDLFNF